jgi:hypothetical protein
MGLPGQMVRSAAFDHDPTRRHNLFRQYHGQHIACVSYHDCFWTMGQGTACSTMSSSQ